MSQNVSPFLESKYGWNYGESGWNQGMDENLIKMGFMFDGNVDAIVSSLPPAVNGNAYFLTDDNRFYFAVGSTFYSSPCPKSFIFKIKSTGDFYIFNGVSAQQVSAPDEVEARLLALETTSSALGTAAFENIEFFATQSELDVVPAQANDYTDPSVLPVKSKVLYALNYGFVDSISSDNTAAAVALLNAAQDGDIIDFCGIVWRIFDGVTGIESSGANPTTDNAVPLTSVPRLVNKSNITLRNGGLYVANQGSSLTKRYFPSTLYIKGCENIVFEDVIFESKGENYGDSDASIGLSVEQRQDFLATNGGHAIVSVRSKNIVGRGVASRLCGSTSVVYSASCYNVRFYDSFSNAASLGYAAYAADSWCGTTAITGFPEHSLFLYNCTSHAESLLRREDLTSVGSNIYSTKGSVTGEDVDVLVSIQGGYYADCYGNSGTDGEFLGHAFSANSSRTIVSGAIVKNCAYVGGTLNSVNAEAKLEISNVVADVGAAVVVQYPISFGQQTISVSNSKVSVDGTRLMQSVTNSAYVISSVVNSSADVTVRNCEFKGAEMLVYRDNTAASYGGVEFDGGYYETNGVFCSVFGWGGSAANSRKGFIVKGGATVNDISSDTSAYINITNLASGSFTYMWVDLKDCNLKSNTFRDINGISNSGVGSLEERVWLPQSIVNLYSTRLPGYRLPVTVTYAGNAGTAGSNLIALLDCDSGYPVNFTNALTSTTCGFIGIISQVSAPTVVSGKLRHSVYFSSIPTEGVDIIVGNKYSLFGN